MLAEIGRLVQCILVCADSLRRWRAACKLVAEFDIVQAAVVAGRGTGMGGGGLGGGEFAGGPKGVFVSARGGGGGGGGGGRPAAREGLDDDHAAAATRAG